MSRFRTFLAGLLLLALACPALAVPVRSRIERVSFVRRSEGEGYIMRLHANRRIEAFSEARYGADGTVEVTLFNTEAVQGYTKGTPPEALAGYTLYDQGQHTVLTLTPADVALTATLYRDADSYDLLLRLTATPKQTNPPVARNQRHDKAREQWRIDTIVLDAGHGGHDHGAVGVGGLREKDVTLAVARQVGAYLEERLGVRVVYTRSDDQFIPLQDRGHSANEAGAKLFVSIHANASPSPAAHGTETFFLGMHKTDAARKVMERENSVIELENDPQHYQTFTQEALIRQVLMQSAWMRQSEHLAGNVERQFGERVGRKSRGVKQAGFFVLWNAAMPSILVELGFVTHPEEAAFLRSAAGQDYMASALFRAIRDFKEQYERSLHLADAEE
jgi:N-acetylmuramoyl-L-alanine amidase